MTAKELYEQQTGDKCPKSQVEYLQWINRYHKWLEAQFIRYYIAQEDKAFQPIDAKLDENKFKKLK